jgi:hypothetical protein
MKHFLIVVPVADSKHNLHELPFYKVANVMYQWKEIKITGTFTLLTNFSLLYFVFPIVR